MVVFSWSLSCSWASCLICCTPSFSLFHHAIFCSFLAFWSDLLLLSLFLLYKGLVTTYTRRSIQMIQSKDSVVIELKVILYAITELFLIILISIESLSHILNNVPYCLPLLQISNKVKAKMCEIVLKNSSNLDLFLQKIS